MIFIALGANLPSRFGSPEETLLAAQAALEARGVTISKSSSIWLSAPVPASDQPWYRNAVVAVETAYEPQELLSVLKVIEVDFGRQSAERDAARPLDLDILAYDDRVYDQAGLQIPHPRMEGRAFVLYPLQEVSPLWQHPVSKRDIASLVDDLPEDQDIHKMVSEVA